MKSETNETKSNWVYNGVWGLLTDLLCVPRHAPTLPALHHEQIVSRKPSRGFLTYLKFNLFAGVVFVIVASAVGSLFLVASETSGDWLGILTIIEAVLLVVGTMFAYLTIHLRFDTMWYVFSDRSMRLRRGIWVIRESTITFENVQNVKVTQGPLQRFFGIANVVVETAGGGGAQQQHGATAGGMHVGLIEGVAEAAEIRDSIMSRVQHTKSSGLGDDHARDESPTTWSPRHIAVLKEIRDAAAALVAEQR